jgi:hypothetical protein
LAAIAFIKLLTTLIQFSLFVLGLAARAVPHVIIIPTSSRLPMSLTTSAAS